ncbi:MAG TPA: phage holin family protein [Candidatus Dormibacteraeota bacterium]|nr:phage holin family protein [Candidatus Dormibacteraeota bacterium]
MRSTAPNGTATRPPEARVVDDLRVGLEDLKVLAGMEVQLARLEAMVSIKRAAIAGGLAVGALLVLYAALIVGLAAVPSLLGWRWAWFIDVGALVLVGGLLALMAFRIAVRAFREAKGTFESIKGDVEWLRQLASRQRNAS